MVTIFETFDPLEADLLRVCLEQSGIDAFIDSSNVGGMRPSLAFVSPIKVLVLENQVEESKKLVLDFEVIRAK
ncbi:MAG: DUF2007 domain-containing protein [Proteobacteria bacterium]|nr:DUF2007 domain-containing protein [Pseudomonadota bacterium]